MCLLAEEHGPILAVPGHENAHACVLFQHLCCMTHCFLWHQGISELSGHLTPPLHLLVQLAEICHCSKKMLSAYRQPSPYGVILVVTYCFRLQYDVRSTTLYALRKAQVLTGKGLKVNSEEFNYSCGL